MHNEVQKGPKLTYREHSRVSQYGGAWGGRPPHIEQKSPFFAGGPPSGPPILGTVRPVHGPATPKNGVAPPVKNLRPPHQNKKLMQWMNSRFLALGWSKLEIGSE